MNIIEAIQAAKDGFIITNEVNASLNQYFDYDGNNRFIVYQIKPGDSEARQMAYTFKFSTHQILDTTWRKFETEVQFLEWKGGKNE